jgi:outer membrane usher protein
MVELVVNGARVSREEIRFASDADSASARPCLSRTLLQRIGVDLGKADAAAGHAVAAETEACGNIGSVVPGASVDFDFEEQRLDVSVPQAYMRNSARGYVSPDLWDQGVNAGFLSYNANTFRTGGSGFDSASTPESTSARGTSGISRR